ncbi:hypothetical protein HJFPF1_01216 [Paramyrothecium foliicola]|nr:hypothetical protein HJFPF1_01216 [Paramyrothecium foliicola]
MDPLQGWHVPGLGLGTTPDDQNHCCFLSSTRALEGQGKKKGVKMATAIQKATTGRVFLRYPTTSIKMAEEQKPVVEVPKEETPATTTAAAPAVVDTKPIEEAPVATTETAPVAEETKAVEADETAEGEAAKPEEKEEVKPVEEGFLSHKAQGLSFPKNLIASKEFFFFSTEAVEPKTLAAYQKSEKSTETAQSNIAWASHTGQGLLFVGDKKNPTSIINLSDATEPEVDGSNKFHLTSKGNKHTFKALNTAERDNWVAQLKLKIAEAKDLVATVTESETYKQTLESFKPVVPAKKEVEAPKEEAPKTDEVPKTEEAPKEDEVKEAAKEEPKVEEPKRRSASRKRASFFGFGKKEEKKEEVKAEEPVAVAPVEAAAAPAPVEDKPVEVEAPKTEETPAVEAAAPAVTTDVPAPAAEDKVVEAESPKEKPSASKRNSFFGGVFSKKEKKAVEAKPVEATEPAKEAESAPAAETAPVIPPVETTTPLAVDVSSPATVPTETTEVPAATATNGETKKDVKEKRKSSLPFAFGKRDKSPSPAEGEEKSPLSAFSKFRATIKGKTTPKAEEKPVEAEPVKEEAAKDTETEAKPEETPVVASKGEVAKPVDAETEAKPETKPENVATTTPAVTAAA